MREIVKTEKKTMTESEYLAELAAAEKIQQPEDYEDEDQNSLMELIDSDS